MEEGKPIDESFFTLFLSDGFNVYVKKGTKVYNQKLIIDVGKFLWSKWLVVEGLAV